MGIKQKKNKIKYSIINTKNIIKYKEEDKENSIKAKKENINYELIIHLFKLIRSNLFSDSLDQDFYKKFSIKKTDMKKNKNENLFTNIYSFKETINNYYEDDSSLIKEEDYNLYLISPYFIRKRFENFLRFLLKQSGKTYRLNSKINEGILNLLENKNLQILLNESKSSIFDNTVYSEIRELFTNFLKKSENVFNIESPKLKNNNFDYRFNLSKITNRTDYSNRFIFYGQIVLEFLENQNQNNVIIKLINCPIHKYINNNNSILIINEIIHPLIYKYGDSGCNCSYKIINPSFIYVKQNIRKTHKNDLSQFFIENTNKLIQQACYLLDISFDQNNNFINIGETRNSLNGAFFYNYLYNKKISEGENSRNVSFWIKGIIPENYTNVFINKNINNNNNQSNIYYNNNESLNKKTRGRPNKSINKKKEFILNTKIEFSKLNNSNKNINENKKEIHKKYFKKSEHIECINCKTNSTSLWRKHENKTICNSCGLYFRLHGRHRIQKMKDIVRRRRRINGILQPSKASKDYKEKINENNNNF